MKFIKNNIKGIIGLIMGLMLAGGITAFATTYFATDIQYKNGKNVAQALNELYNATQLNTRINALETQVSNLETASSNCATKEELAANSNNGIEETVLWEGTVSQSARSKITLNDSINNYKYILIGTSYIESSTIGKGITNIVLKVKDIKSLGYSTSNLQYLYTTYSTNHIWYSFGSDTTLYITAGDGNAYLKSITGIK